MKDQRQDLKSLFESEESSKLEGRLINILLYSEHRYRSNKDDEIERRKKESARLGSLCLDKKDLPGEKWEKYNSEVCDANEIFVSSYGRVKYQNKGIVPQKDSGKEIGYLVLDTKTFDKKFPVQENYVYQMVANTFLKKKKNDGTDIHHITNNGYDNSVENLICLQPDQHTRIHNSVKSILSQVAPHLK